MGPASPALPDVLATRACADVLARAYAQAAALRVPSPVSFLAEYLAAENEAPGSGAVVVARWILAPWCAPDAAGIDEAGFDDAVGRAFASLLRPSAGALDDAAVGARIPWPDVADLLSRLAPSAHEGACDTLIRSFGGCVNDSGVSFRAFALCVRAMRAMVNEHAIGVVEGAARQAASQLTPPTPN